MSVPQILRAADRVATLWKNGLGVTREIAVHPPGAGLDDFDWRISMAEVTAGGPFSNFPGIDRVLAVLEGRLALSIAGEAPIELGPRSPPLAFPGDVPVEAALLAGPVADLNLMVRRGRVQATLERLRIAAPTALAIPRTTIILARHDGVRVRQGAFNVMLGKDDAVLLDQASHDIQLEPRQASTLFVIRLATSGSSAGAN